MKSDTSPYDAPADTKSLEPPASDHDAVHWGVAAMVVGVVLFLTAPVVLVLAVGIWEFSYRGSDVVMFHAWVARIGVALVAVLCLISIVFAVKTVRRVPSSKSSPAIPIGGLVLSISASIFWLMTAIALLNTTESMVRLYVR